MGSIPFDESIQDQIVAASHISSLEKYKFIIDHAGRPTITTGSSPLTKRFEEASAGVYYLGEAKLGSATSEAVWRIQKIIETGPLLEILWADSDSNFDNVWNDRAILTYN
jgi:hypothetical protein